MVTTTNQALERYPHLVEQNKRLKRWKREALIVLDEWEAVWEAAGRPGPLGKSKAANVLAELERLKSKEM